jgi:hypothetical protein
MKVANYQEVEQVAEMIYSLSQKDRDKLFETINVIPKRDVNNNLTKFSKFIGILSKERALEFEKHIEETRNEWNRNS